MTFFSNRLISAKCCARLPILPFYLKDPFELDLRHLTGVLSFGVPFQQNDPLGLSPLIVLQMSGVIIGGIHGAY